MDPRALASSVVMIVAACTPDTPRADASGFAPEEASKPDEPEPKARGPHANPPPVDVPLVVQGQTWVDQTGMCWRSPPSSCDPGSECNPPAPQPTPCPPELQGEQSERAAKVRVDDDGRCWVDRDETCGPDGSCRPARPFLVVCPPHLRAP